LVLHPLFNERDWKREELLNKGIRSHELRQDIDLNAAAILFFGTMRGLVNIWALDDYGFNPKRDINPSGISFVNL
jgi:hypothetical protein